MIINDNLLDHIPDDWGLKHEGGRFAFAHTRTGANAINFNANAHYVLLLISPQPDRVLSINSDQRKAFLAPSGAVEIIPQSSDVFAQWKNNKENILFAIDDKRLRNIAHLEFGSQDFELQPTKPGHVDQCMAHFGQMVKLGLSAENKFGNAYFDSAATMLGIHILKKYSSLKSTDSQVQASGGLTPKTWRLIDEYIRSHLHLHLTIEVLARLSALSPSYFIRAFTRGVGVTPHKYIIERRIEYAETLLRGTDMPLSMIAMRSGFASNSHMTAMFRRIKGITPTVLRRENRRSI